MATINGGAGNDVLNGTGADDVINGLGGDDTLTDAGGNDKLDGGVGNDALSGGEDNDTLLGGAGNDTLDGRDDNDTLVGDTGNDRLDGEAGLDTLSGGAGNDRLDGGAGIDQMDGGGGNDFYVVDEVADSVTELANGGVDLIVASVSLTLGANLENLELSGVDNIDGTGNELSNQIIGNDGNNKLDGGIGNDTLVSSGGTDTMTGGTGNDTYVVDSLDDVIKEIAGQGKDTVIAESNYVLAADADIEVLNAFDNSADVELTGNGLANFVTGNTGNNTLNGGGGGDTLNGGLGDDRLDGGTGKDVMTGGKGDDTYFVDDAGDKLTELANQGTDAVFSSLASFTLAANFEELFLEGAALNGTGNGVFNLVVGNDLGNTLNGLGGNDSLFGFDGADTLLGGIGNDLLDGGTGKDVMTGGTGNDTYDVLEADDQVNESAGGGNDTVRTTLDNVIVSQFANIENLTLLGNDNLSVSGDDQNNRLTGNIVDNMLTGGKGNDTLDGGGGNDTLIGGKGNDIYFLNGPEEHVTEAAGEGKDTVFSEQNFVLDDGQEVEIVSLVGNVDANVTGNELANTINGNAGNNELKGGIGRDTLSGAGGNDTLDGGDGNDVMSGGKGNDTYIISALADKVNESAGQGIDTVESGLTAFTLGANVEALTLTGAALNGTGNTLGNRINGNALGNTLDGAAGNDALEGGAGNDTLKGGAGNDTLDGGDGNDAMTGGAGNDVYFLLDAGDKATEGTGAGIDEVRTSLNNFVLGANIESLRVIGIAGLVATGNDLSNFMVGNDGKDDLTGGKGNDTLDGALGADTLRGGLGNDVYFVDNPGDVVEETAGQGKDTVKSSVDFTITENQEIETLILSGGAATGIGNSLANVITITSDQFAFLFGNGGNDVLTGAGGNDDLDGGDGNDALDGGNGGIGEDTLFGGAGNDTLKGGNGNDALDGGTGSDAMVGGKGDDTYVVLESGDKVTELAGQGTDTIESHVNLTLGANVENLILVFASGAINGTGNILANNIIGNEVANKLDGGGGNDILAGRDGLDTLQGGAGDDELFGDGEVDLLKGGAGNDILDGGSGADILFGEAGGDVFRYAIEGESELPELGGDIINDFQSGADKIDVSDLLNAFDIDPADAFTDQHVLFGKVGADTLLQFDSDGAGGAGPVTLATITGATLTQSDFVLTSSDPL
jgi:trimeric autotransporter adhesin